MIIPFVLVDEAVMRRNAADVGARRVIRAWMAANVTTEE
jgi:hypothetical protein